MTNRQAILKAATALRDHVIAWACVNMIAQAESTTTTIVFSVGGAVFFIASFIEFEQLRKGVQG